MALFDRALLIEGRERRAAFLRQECADADLIREVEELLEHDERQENLADRAEGQALAWVMDAPAPSGDASAHEVPVSKRIGEFRVLRVLGRGGMGVVYEAEQDSPRRSVALKVIRTVFANEEDVARFQREANLLGRLRHPAIAQIYSSGTVEGVPYLAMELVPGRPLDEFAEGLSLRAKLRLMQRICEGVQHAHSKGVIHRDLKASNILVEESGAPKVLDFGIARATDGDDIGATRTGQVLGTLETMSPEQALGGPDGIDTRCDIYALGAILYQLIAGAPLFDLRSMSTVDALRTIAADEPMPLDTRVAGVPRDVVTIIAKSMSKDRERRYASVATLAADIGRHLSAQPIAARPATTMYVLTRFAHRHRTLVASAVAILVALLGGLAAASYGFLRASAERDRARESERLADQKRSEAEAVTSVLVEALKAANPTETGRDLSVRDLFDSMAPSIELDNKERPGVEARLSLVAGCVYRVIGDFDRAEELLDRARALAPIASTSGDRFAESVQSELAALASDRGAYEDALEQFEPLVEAALAEPEIDPLEVSRLLQRKGGVLLRLDRPAEAIRDVEHALEIIDRVDSDTRIAAADARLNLGLLHSELSQLDEARALVVEALEVYRRLGHGEYPRAAHALYTLGNIDWRRSVFAVAEESYREALALYEHLYDRGHAETAHALFSLSRVIHAQGRFAEALEFGQRALEMRTAILPEGHPEIANARVQIARVHRDSGNLEGSETELRSAIVSLDGHAGMQVDAAWARHALVQTLCRMGRAVEAEPLQRAVVETMTTRRGALHSDTLTARGGLGFVLSTQGKYAEALELTEELLAKHRELLGDDHIEVAADILNLGTVHERLGHLQTAAELTNEAAVRFRRSLGATHPQTLKVEAQLARIVANFGDEEGADGPLDEVLELRRHLLGEGHPSTLFSVAELAREHLAHGDPSAALALTAKALETASEALPAGHRTWGRLHGAHGRALALSGEPDAAEEHLLRSYEILAESEPPGSEVLNELLRTLANYFEARGFHEDARAFRDELAGTR